MTKAKDEKQQKPKLGRPASGRGHMIKATLNAEAVAKLEAVTGVPFKTWLQANIERIANSADALATAQPDPQIKHEPVTLDVSPMRDLIASQQRQIADLKETVLSLETQLIKSHKKINDDALITKKMINQAAILNKEGFVLVSDGDTKTQALLCELIKAVNVIDNKLGSTEL